MATDTDASPPRQEKVWTQGKIEGFSGSILLNCSIGHASPVGGEISSLGNGRHCRYDTSSLFDSLIIEGHAN